MKLTFDEVMERLADERNIQPSMVPASVLRRKVWVAEWHIPGCLSESQSICRTKADAIDAALDFTGADDSDEIEHAVRGMRAALRRGESFQHHTEMFGTVTTTVDRLTIGDLL